jgi:hypothetical protein
MFDVDRRYLPRNGGSLTNRGGLNINLSGANSGLAFPSNEEC